MIARVWIDGYTMHNLGIGVGWGYIAGWIFCAINKFV